ncbi:methyltransferase domain-containing protein [Arthrobacter sp. UYCu712]|uniref:class I SAM-dependent DNA methyltransferase n=1 Tax=Arthrobacter sp. UYCu712 TaxID=3156340 RepID=UPI00339B56D6
MHGDDRLALVRSAYDVVAQSYARLLPDASFEAPEDRRMIESFAASVSGGPALPVVDAGCGAGRMTRLLSTLGIDVAGIDLSAGMVDVARRTYPDLSFEVAELADLPYSDMALGGVFAWYSIIHSPPGDLPRVFAEFHRVLAPGGHAMFSFQVGDGPRQLSRAYGHDVSMEAHLFAPEAVIEQLTVAGFKVVARMTRGPGPREKSPQAVLLAQRRPAAEQPRYVRYQARHPNGRGTYPGIFALANGLADGGKLSKEDRAAWRQANDRFDSACPDPATVDASVYDRGINPTAQSWFKTTAKHLLADLPFYKELLRRHGIEFHVLHSDDPGSLLYEDEVQIVVAPRLTVPAAPAGSP